MAGETLPTGSTNTQGLADWAAPYITNYLGKAQSLAETPYEAYKGPLTAGTSDLQNKAFQGIANLTFPSNYGQSFSSTGAYQAPAMNMDAYKTQPIGTGSYKRPSFEQYTSTLGPNQQPAVNKNVYDAGLAGNQIYNAAQPGTYDDYLKDIGDLAVLPQTREQFDAEQNQLGQQRQQGMDMLRRGNPNEIMAGLGGQPGQMPQGGLAGLLRNMPQQQQQPQNIAQQYMNPYLQSVLTPQLEELRRQNEITNMGANAKLTGAGAYGGGRQAIMNAENNRNLMQEMNKTVGQGYASAYDKGMGQFNTEQGQFKDVINLIGNAGAQERGITSEGIAADKAEFEAQRQFPFQQAQYMRDMISGLPTGSVTNTPANLSGTGAFLSALGGGTAAASALGYKNVGDLLKSLGLDLGPKTPVDE